MNKKIWKLWMILVGMMFVTLVLVQVYDGRG